VRNAHYEVIKTAEIKPMLFTETSDMSLLERKDRWFQIKYNGERVLAHIKGGRIVGLRNRSNMPVLYLYPELERLRFDFGTAILDAEVCVFLNGKSVFYGGIDQRSRSRKGIEVMKKYPVMLMVFDALRFEDEVLIHKPYQYRYKVIKGNIAANGHIEVVENHEDGRELWKMVLEADLEGLMAKDPFDVYELGARSANNLKLKNYKPAVLVVEQAEQNSAGTKVFGTAKLKDGKEIQGAECQLAGVSDLPVGAEIAIRYLDIYNGKLIQPHKLAGSIKGNVLD